MAALPDLHVSDSSEAMLSGRKPPFRLLVRAAHRDGRKVNIRHAVSEGFVVSILSLCSVPAVVFTDFFSISGCCLAPHLQPTSAIPVYHGEGNWSTACLCVENKVAGKGDSAVMSCMAQALLNCSNLVVIVHAF